MAIKRLLEATGVGSLFAALGDIILFGGDQIAEVLIFMFATIDLWLPFALRLERLAELVEWLPEDAVQRLVVIFAALAVLVYAYRLYKRWQSNQ